MDHPYRTLAKAPIKRSLNFRVEINSNFSYKPEDLAKWIRDVLRGSSEVGREMTISVAPESTDPPGLDAQKFAELLGLNKCEVEIALGKADELDPWTALAKRYADCDNGQLIERTRNLLYLLSIFLRGGV